MNCENINKNANIQIWCFPIQYLKLVVTDNTSVCDTFIDLNTSLNLSVYLHFQQLKCLQATTAQS